LIMHKSADGLRREQIVKQVTDNKDQSLHDWKSYVPIGNARALCVLSKWPS